MSSYSLANEYGRIDWKLQCAHYMQKLSRKMFLSPAIQEYRAKHNAIMLPGEAKYAEALSLSLDKKLNLSSKDLKYLVASQMLTEETQFGHYYAKYIRFQFHRRLVEKIILSKIYNFNSQQVLDLILSIPDYQSQKILLDRYYLPELNKNKIKK